MTGLSSPLQLCLPSFMRVPQPPSRGSKLDPRICKYYSRVFLFYPLVLLVFETRNSNLEKGLGSSLFARRYYGNRFFFLFLRVLRCFSSPGCLRMAMDSPYDNRIQLRLGYPIRVSTGQSLLAAHRSFSQLTAPFFVS